MENKTKFSLWYIIVALWGVFLLHDIIALQYKPKVIPYSEFLNALKENRIVEVVITHDQVAGKMKDTVDGKPEEVNFEAYRVDPTLSGDLAEHNVKFRGEPESTLLRDVISWTLPALIFVGIWYLLIGRMMGGSNQGVMSFGKSKAKIYAEKEIQTKFEDVAGEDEAKEELHELVEYLTEPGRFRTIGGQLPKGVLLVGPPGTGKTLLARAVAGEAGVPFFTISGSEFVEMFVGVGAARVRELFHQAREKAPCIIFIDELDAIGKARAGFSVGGHDEREQTLNQLLVEMDGFDPSAGVVILAATNRPETLDPALLRAGRFDRQVLVDRPDVNGREAILKIHAKKVRLAEGTDLRMIAQKTPGFSGADLANLINEAALLAARKRREEVGVQELDDAVDRIISGLEKKNRVINPREKEIVAHHETGHALVAAFTPGGDKVHKISIIPRGIGALGFTQQLPTEDRYLMTRGELLGKMDVLLGGRMAEMVVFGEASTGAHNDLQRATDLARAMVAEYGMGETLGLSTYPRQKSPSMLGPEHAPYLGKEYSEATAAKLDEEIRGLIESRANHVRELLTGKRDMLERVANCLLEKEVIDGEEFQRLIGEVSGASAAKAKQSE
ncbi:MAG: ATP-dependent zinc metalloprotease FtsH [Syntrophobacteraceae bacterium]